MDLNQTSDQMEMFGFTAEGAQQETDKFVGEDKKPKTGLRFTPLRTVSLDDIKEEERDRVRAEYKLNDESFSFRNLYNKIPTNARLLIENVLGKDSDITEKNFTNDELIEMILLAEKQEENFRNVRNRKFKNQPENVTTVSPYFRDPDAKGVTTRVDESYKDSLIRTFTDPQYRVATSLGRFDVEKNPSGLRITDEYDFNKVQRDLPTDLKGILRHIRYSPELAGEYLANLLDTPSREVNINIPKKMFKGGAVMEDQMEMAFMQEGGIIDDDLDVDPVSGNEVPPGSLAEEVRDDIPAQLSEGEYVVPADVVRYYGVKFFEDLRDQAKMGLAEMEANGRIGGEPVPDGGPVNDQELSEQEMAAIREVMGMAEGGEVQNPYLQQQQLYSQPRPAPIDEKRNTTITGINPVENQMPMQSMASGGQVQGYQTGGAGTTATPSPAVNTIDLGQFGLGYSFMGQPQQMAMVNQTGTAPGTATNQVPEGQTYTVLYHPDYAKNKQSKSFYLPRDSKIYAEYIKRGYTLEIPGLGGETTTTDTPITTDLTGAKVTTGGGPKGSNTGISSITGSMEDKDLDKTTKGLGLLADLSFALAGQLGVPLATLINTKAVAEYNDKLKDQSKRKGSIFGGEGSIYEGLTDVSGDKKKNFADTWLGDLLGFDKKAGVQGPNLKDSFMGARRGFDTAQLKGTVASPIEPKSEPTSGPTGIAGERIVSTPTKPKIVSTQKESEAAARKRRRERQRKSREAAKAAIDKRKTAVKKADKILKKGGSTRRITGKGAKALDARKKKSKAFDKGGLMNKKGDK